MKNTYRKDPTEFRLRFAAWKNGELVYEHGLPKYVEGKEGDTLYVERDAYKGWRGVKNFVKSALKSTFNYPLYRIFSRSGGQPNIQALAGGMNYSGSYKYPAKNSYKGQELLPDPQDNSAIGTIHSTNEGKSLYGGDNADMTRNLVALLMNRKNNIKKIRNGSWNIGDVSYNGPIYEGKIYPLREDSTYYIPKSVKAELDSLINLDRSYNVNLNQLPVDRRFPKLTLDNVRHARLKPIKNLNGDYFLRASKLWDLHSPLIGIIGDISDFITKLTGGSKYVLEQTIPIKFIDDKNVDWFTNDWKFIRNTMVNPAKGY